MSKPSRITPMNKSQIIERIGKGPTSFEELAIAKNSQHPARVMARKICDGLVSDGTALLIFIGPYRYYILNTEEAKRQAIIQQIEENSRKDPDTGCTIWTGYVDEMRGPTMRQALLTGESAVNVRRWLFQDLTGKDLQTNESIKMKARCSPDCIDPTHMVKKLRSQIYKGKKKSITHRIALQQAAKRRWGTDDEVIKKIRESEKSRKELAAEFGMTASNVWCIKTGRTHNLGVQVSQFSGLIR